MKRPCLTLMIACACPAWAQSDTTVMPEGSTGITLSLGAALLPRAEGSTKTRVVVLAGASVQWSNGVFLTPGTLGMQLSASGWLGETPAASPVTNQDQGHSLVKMLSYHY